MSRTEHTVLNAEERDIARRLAELPAGEPPPELLDRLKAEVPDDLAARLEAGDHPAAPTPPRRRWLAAAAAVVTLVGGGWLAWSVWQDVPPAGEVAQEAAVPAVRDEAEREEEDSGRSGDAGEVRQRPEGPRPAAPREQGEDHTLAGSSLEGEDRRPQPGSAVGESEAMTSETAAPKVSAADTEAAASSGAVEESFAAEGEGAGRAPEADASPAGAAAEAREEDLAPPSTSALRARGGRVREEAAPAEGRAEMQGLTLSAEPEPRRPVASFVDTADDRLSTFGLYVDAGSYTAVRAALRQDRLPPPARVRVEEMVNAYRYADPFAVPPPEPGETFRVLSEGAPSPYAPGPRHRLLRFQLTARPESPVERRPQATAGPPRKVAEGASARVEFDPRTVARWRLLGYENHATEDERFRWDHAVDAGEIGAGQTVTVLYEVELAEPAPAPGQPLALLELRWRDPGEELFREEETWLRTADLSPSWRAAPPDLRLAATVAELGEILRRSPHAAKPGTVAREARRLAAERPDDEQVAELVELAELAGELLEEEPEEGCGP